MALQSLTILGFTLMEADPPILNITAGLATLKRCHTVLAKGSDFKQKWEVDIGRRRLVHVEQNSFRSKKVDRWRHRAELVNQGATLVFRCFCPALVNDCTMHDAFIRCCHQTRKLLMCRICFFWPAWKRAYHDLPWLTDSIRLKGCGILILSAPGKKWFRFELLVHFNPLQQGALHTGDSPDT